MDTAHLRPLYLTFALAGEPCAVPALRVVEVVELKPLTRVPTVPPFIRGVMNLRGQVLPVVDLALKFGFGEVPVTGRACVVVTEVPVASAGDGQDRTQMGILTEDVDKVVELGPADVEAPPAFGTAIKVEFLLGLGKIDQRFVLLLDVDRVLTAPEAWAVASSADAIPPDVQAS